MHHNYYETSDLGLATALVAVGHHLIDINRLNPRRAVFIFDKTSEVDDAVNKYWHDELVVSAQHYFETIKRVKSRLYE